MPAPKLTSDFYDAAVGGRLTRAFRAVRAWGSSESGGWIIIAVLAFTAIAVTGAALILPRLGPPSAVESVQAAASAGAPALEQELADFTLAPEAIQNISQDQARVWNAARPFSKDTIRPARAFFAPPADVESYSRALDCLTTAIYYEAASESAAGQAAVAQVVVNRARHPAYPRTICGVVFQGSERSTGCQFSFTCDGAMARPPSVDGWARARAVAASALNGTVVASVGTATHYHTDWVAPYWAPRLTKIAKIGTHIFYRWNGAWGLPSAFTGAYVGAEPVVAKMAALSTLSVEAPAEVLDLSLPTLLAVSTGEGATEAPIADPLIGGPLPEEKIDSADHTGQVAIAPILPSRPILVLQRDVPIMADPLANPASTPARQRQRIAAPSGW